MFLTCIIEKMYFKNATLLRIFSSAEYLYNILVLKFELGEESQDAALFLFSLQSHRKHFRPTVLTDSLVIFKHLDVWVF